MPKYNRYQQKGFGELGDPNMLKQGTQLPFDDTGAKFKNLQAIAANYGDIPMGVSQDIVEAVQTMVPAAANFYGYKGSLYDGVSGDYY